MAFSSSSIDVASSPSSSVSSSPSPEWRVNNVQCVYVWPQKVNCLQLLRRETPRVGFIEPHPTAFWLRKYSPYAGCLLAAIYHQLYVVVDRSRYGQPQGKRVSINTELFWSGTDCFGCCDDYTRPRLRRDAYGSVILRSRWRHVLRILEPHASHSVFYRHFFRDAFSVELTIILLADLKRLSFSHNGHEFNFDCVERNPFFRRNMNFAAAICFVTQFQSYAGARANSCRRRAQIIFFFLAIVDQWPS